MFRIAGIHGEAMYTAPDYPQGVCHIRKAAELPTAVQCAARAVLQDKNCQCAGSRGKAPCVLLGDLKGAILSRERMAPFNAPPARCRDKSSAAALHPLRPTGAKRNSPRGLLSSRARGAKVVQIVNMGYLSPFPLFFLWIICSIDFWRFRG